MGTMTGLKALPNVSFGYICGIGTCTSSHKEPAVTFYLTTQNIGSALSQNLLGAFLIIM